jgi:hypothetical protein
MSVKDKNVVLTCGSRGLGLGPFGSSGAAQGGSPLSEGAPS